MEINHFVLCVAFLVADLRVTVCLHFMHAIHYFSSRDTPPHLPGRRYINDPKNTATGEDEDEVNDYDEEGESGSKGVE